jgi:hypothetical protein
MEAPRWSHKGSEAKRGLWPYWNKTPTKIEKIFGWVQ